MMIKQEKWISIAHKGDSTHIEPTIKMDYLVGIKPWIINHV
jgi:hypothetical protein